MLVKVVTNPGLGRPRAHLLRGRADVTGLISGVLKSTAKGGQAAAVLLTGEEGIGKTAVATTVADRAARVGFAVGHGRYDDTADNSPLSALLLALRWGREPLVPSEPFAELAPLYDRLPWLIDKVAGLLDAIAARCPVLLVLEDVQWADELSVPALRMLASRLAGRPVVWLMSARDPSSGAEAVVSGPCRRRIVEIGEIGESAPVAGGSPGRTSSRGTLGWHCRCMLLDGSRIEVSDLPDVFDYIVVGAGSAGSAVAARLLGHEDARVLLLEAGDGIDGDDVVARPSRWVENLGSRRDWQHRYGTEPHLDDRTLPLPQGKALGGSSSINGLIWMRGDRAVYDQWAEAGNPGWDYESVLPLFRGIEDWEDGSNALHGAGGPIRVERARDPYPVATALIEAATALDVPYLDDLNMPSPSGVGPVTMNIRDGQRVSSWTGYLAERADDHRLTVVTAAHVRKLAMVGDRCVGVEVTVEDRLWSPRAEREIVLSAGAIGSPAPATT